MSEQKAWDVRLTFDCTSLETKKSPTVSVSVSPTPVTISNLKTVIQSKFSIPKCLQKISLDSGLTFLSDYELISDLYVRSSDVFTVTYLARAEVKFIKHFDTHNLCPLLIKLGDFSDKNGGFSSYRSSGESVQAVCNGFRTIAYSHLLPWEQRSTVEANRQFLVQEEIIDKTLRLYHLLSQTPYSDRELFLQDLEISCLSLLWNFAETREARVLVAQRGGFELMMKSLVYRPEKSYDKSGVEYNMYDLFDHSVGCVSNYSEIEQCQLPLASNKLALDSMLEFAVGGSSLNIFTKLLIANCLFRLSHNIHTHKYLAETKTLEMVLSFFYKFQDNLSYSTSLVVGYVLTVTLSRILSFSLEQVPPELVGKLVAVLNTFISAAQRVGWNKVTQSLEKDQCNWITMAPFIDVFFAPLFSPCDRDNHRESTASLVYEDCPPVTGSRPEKKHDENEPLALSSITESCLSISVMGLKVEMSRPINRSLAISQGILDYLVCLPWIVPAKFQSEVCSVLKLFQADVESLSAPRLHSLAAASLAQTGDFYLKDSFNF